ncbi:MAG: hypothetical protein QM740_02230 [Acidovorax sp.]
MKRANRAGRLGRAGEGRAGPRSGAPVHHVDAALQQKRVSAVRVATWEQRPSN